MNKFKRIASNIGSGVAMLSILFAPALILTEYPKSNTSWLDYAFWGIVFILSICYSYYIFRVLYSFIDLDKIENYIDRCEVEKTYNEKIIKQKKSTTK